MINLSNSKNYLLGLNTKELTLLVGFFDLYPSVIYWRVDFEIKALGLNNLFANGTGSMNLKINEKPFNGSCKINSTSGYTLIDYFLIECSDWIDNDGYIARYEYFGKFKNKETNIKISFLILLILKNFVCLNNNLNKIFILNQLIIIKFTLV